MPREHHKYNHSHLFSVPLNRARLDLMKLHTTDVAARITVAVSTSKRPVQISVSTVSVTETITTSHCAYPRRMARLSRPRARL